jgi:hypothetical protein
MDNDEYWNEAIGHRQELCFEIHRLIQIAKGFYLDELMYNLKYNNKTEINLKNEDLLYFIKYSKRPYGNKDIEASICYNLGWDWNKSLREKDVPLWVINEAKKVHEAVINKLKENSER